MKHKYLLWTGHLAAVLLLAGGVWWLMGDASGMPDYKMVIALAAMTALVVNHLRWWNLSREIGDRNILEKVDLLVVANYMIFILAFSLAELRA